MNKIVFKSENITLAEIASVATLHKNAIKLGFLSSLGERFLQQMYLVISRGKASFLVLALDEGQVVGFVSAAHSKGLIWGVLFKKCFFPLIFVLLPKIFSISNIKKIIDILAYSFHPSEKKDSGLSEELLSLAVDEKYCGQGIARGLFEQLTRLFQEQGVRKFKIVVGEALIPAQRFYEKMGAQRHGKLELHRGEISWVYIYDVEYLGKGAGNKSDYNHRFSALFQRIGQKSIILDNVLWTSYQKMVVPVGPVLCNYAITSDKYRDDLLGFFKNSVLIRAGCGFVETPDDWYSVLCDRPIDLSVLSSKYRSEMRRGLRNCDVRRVDVNFMVEHAWPVFSSAFKRYRNDSLKMSKKQFRRSILLTDGFEDIIHYWGVFEKKTGRLIAYAQNYLFEKIEVNYWTIKFYPQFLRLYSSYALFYEMNRYYLEEEKFAYVNDGFRSLLHETNIQNYLISKFSFRKQPVGLQIHYRPFVGKSVSLTYPYRNLLGKLCQPLDALYKLEEINRVKEHVS